MSENRFPRVGRPAFLAVVALASVVTGTAAAQAQEIQTFPGSSCQASGSAQDLYYSGLTIANRGDATSSAVCPIVRANPLAAWTGVAVFVRDRHSTQEITCRAEARDVWGTAGTGWSETQSTTGEGSQALVFGPPPAGAVPAYGAYVVVCSLPPMEEVNQPSYISSYLIVEP
jgi:hypothetical protein